MSNYPLKVAEWPAEDQAIWRRMTVQGGPLDEGGELAHLRGSSLHNVATAYGRWLAWLGQNHVDALKQSPLGRITHDRVGRWLASLNHLAPNSRKIWLDGLIRYVVGAAPQSEFPFLRDYQRQLLRLAQDNHGRRKIGRIPSLFDVIEAGLNYADCGVENAKSQFERARRLRDAAMIVVLAMAPVRRRNFVGLAVGQTIHVDEEKIVISLSAEEVKNKLRFEMILREPGAALLRRYINDARPFLQARSHKTSNALWLADTGLPYSYGYLGTRITLLTEKLLGMKVPPHFFRDATATTFARTSPELARGIKAILGHTDHRTSERHYNHAQAIEAGREYSAIIGEMTAGNVFAPKP